MIGSRKRAKKPTGRDSQLNLHFGRQNKEHTLLALKEGPVFRVRSMPQRLQCKRVWKGKVEKNHYTFSYPLGKVKDVKKFGKIFNQSALSLSPLGIQSRESNSNKVFPSRKTTNRKSTPSLSLVGTVEHRNRLKKHSYQKVHSSTAEEDRLTRQLVDGPRAPKPKVPFYVLLPKISPNGGNYMILVQGDAASLSISVLLVASRSEPWFRSRLKPEIWKRVFHRDLYHSNGVTLK
ncbi:hypothetical protein NPIL_132131 [Nephila pilipes]|uniref:Uncharacterized protein n=1 Tax=Nephila pilipes TaxID=299642 RepID=A0A8X6TV31_NEPPI|nr:hypothetical protein NPIL_132131 [Nephila pilipes]